MTQPRLPANDLERLSQAIVLLRSGRFAEAAEIYRGLLAAFPSSTQLLTRLGTAFVQIGNVHEGLELLKRSLEISGDHAEALQQYGIGLARLNHLEEALDMFKRAIRSMPNNGLSYYFSGQALVFLNRQGEAVSYFDQAISLLPEFPDAYIGRANALSNLNRPNEALADYRRVLALEPRRAEAYFNRALVLKGMGRLDEALVDYDKAISIRPDFGLAYINRGNLLHSQEHCEQALRDYDHAIRLAPDNHTAHLNRGITLSELGQFKEALASFDLAIKLAPSDANTRFNLGIALRGLERLDDALASYDQAIALRPDYAEASMNRGIVLVDLGRLDEALASYDRAIALRPDYAEAFMNRGIVLVDLGRLDEALASYDRAIALRPDYAEAFMNRGNAMHDLGRLEDALADCDRAIGLKPDVPYAHYNRGIVLGELKRLEESVASYERAIELRPGYAEAFMNRGIVLGELKRFGEALASHDHAVRLKPDSAEAFMNRGIVLAELKRFDEALASYDLAIKLNPRIAEAYNNLGVALGELKRFDEALAGYDHALQLNPDLAYLPGLRLHTKMQLCQWDRLNEERTILIDQIRQGKPVSPPFPVLALSDSASVQRRCAETYVAGELRCLATRAARKPPKHERIRIGYFSADFREHPVMHLMAELFELHDRDKFELFAFSFGRADQDAWRQRAMAAFDQFIDVHSSTDNEVVQLVRSLEIDIAVDLMGFTKNNRSGILARGVAPIQVNYLGYPGTMGAGYIDYIIADGIVIPEEERPSYSEKIAYLPNCFQVNDRKQGRGDKVYSRKELGLPETGFVFCSFNSNYKIMPDIFRVWMRLLREVRDSVLWIYVNNPAARENLIREASKVQIAPERLVFANRMPLEDHLSRLRYADLFLDTFPFNGGTTASNALRSGLPVVTCAGGSFASRMAASLLNAVGLPELVAASLADYETLALALAMDRMRLGEVRSRLRDNLPGSPLYDTPLFARHIEAAYLQMYQRLRHGLPPDHIFVKP